MLPVQKLLQKWLIKRLSMPSGAGTFANYKRSSEWRARAESTRKLHERHEKIIARVLGDRLVERLRASNVLWLRDVIEAEAALRNR
jgi:hypothetical protein